MLHDHLVNLLLQAEGDAEAQEKRRDMEADVKTNVENAQRKQKLYYDQKHAAGDLFTVGSLVLKKDFRRKRRRGGKMDYRWQGPFAITAVLGKGLYSLKERDGDLVLNKCMFLYLNLVGESFYALS